MVLLNTPTPREKRQNERERSEGRLTGQGDAEERKAYVGWSILSLSLSLSPSRMPDVVYRRTNRETEE